METKTMETITELKLNIVFEADELIGNSEVHEALDEVVRLIKKGFTGGYAHGYISEWSFDDESEDVETLEDEWGNPQIVDED